LGAGTGHQSFQNVSRYVMRRNLDHVGAIDRRKLRNRNLQNPPSSRTLNRSFTRLSIRGCEMVRFIEIAAPMLVLAYAATYMAMRYFFPPEMKR
jgi:hypothetical protein